jgi:hypothetical protein
VLEAYGPFGNPGSPLRKGEDPNILEDPVIKDIAEKHKVTIAQVPKKNNACTFRDIMQHILVCSNNKITCVHVINFTLGNNNRFVLPLPFTEAWL